MTYGIPTLMEFDDISVLSRFCSENGYAFVEMNMTFPWFQPGAVDADRLRALAERDGIQWTIHLHDRVDPFEFSPEMRQAYLENVRFALSLGRALGMPRLNMHLMPGTYSAVNGKKVYLYGQCRERYLDHVRAFRDLVDQALRGTDTVFCIENTSGFLDFQREAIEILLGSPVFGLTFDIGHSFKSGGQDETYILTHRDRLRHFHLHDCSMKSNHLGFGMGGLDIPRYAALAAELDCTAVAEVKESGELTRSKAYLIERNLWQA